MSKTCPPGAPSHSLALEAFDRLWTITPEDIETGWIDVMTKRLLKELNRQLSQAEAIKEDPAYRPTAAERALNASTLCNLQKAVRDIAKLDKERDARKAAKGKYRGDTRGAIHVKAIRHMDAGTTKEISQKSKR